MLKRLSLRCDQLEARITPAVNEVSATFSAGVLTLVGDDYNNEVVVTPNGGGSFTVTGQNGTLIVGGPTFTGVTSIKANLLDGNDAFIIDSTAAFALTGPANIDLGDGNNQLSLVTTAKLELGSLTVTAGDGHDQVGIGGGAGSLITGNATLNLGVGFNATQPPYNDTNVYLSNIEIAGPGGLKFTALDGDEHLFFNAVKVTKALNVKGGEGSIEIAATSSQFGSVILNSAGPSYPLSTNAAILTAADSTIAGTVMINSLAGVQVHYVNTTSGAVTINSGPTDTTTNFAGASAVIGNLTINGGRHSVTADPGSVVTINGNITVNANSQASLSVADGRLKARSIMLNGKSGADYFSYEDSTALEVEKGFTLRGPYVQYIQQAGAVTVGGGLSLLGKTDAYMEIGTSYSNIAPIPSLTVTGPTLIQGRKLDYRQYESQATYNNGLSLLGGESTEFLSAPWQLPGDFDSPPYGNGSTTTVTGKPFLMSGREVEYHQYEGVANYSAGWKLTGGESASVEAFPKDYGIDEALNDVYGIGAKITADKLSIMGEVVSYFQEEGEATFAQGVKLNATGSASFQTQAGFIETPTGVKLGVTNGGLEVSGGSAQYVQYDGVTTITGNLKVKGKEGASFNTSWDDADVGAKLNVTGSIIVDAGTGGVGFSTGGESLAVMGDVSVKGAGLSRTYFSSRAGSTVGGNVSVTGATGYPDYFTADTNLAVTGNTTINLGNGANWIQFNEDEGTSTLTGNLTITTGSGSDNVLIGAATIAGTTKINTGAGTDGLFLLNGATFNGALLADLGSGADKFEAGAPFLDGFGIEQIPAGTVTINAASTVKLGANNDAVKLGVVGDLLGKVLFGASGTLTVDGGANLNLFDDELGQYDITKVTLLGITDPTP